MPERREEPVEGEVLWDLRDRAGELAALEHAQAADVAFARRLGCSWSEIGRALGVSKQAAQQRYGATSAPPVPRDQLMLDV